MGQRADQWLFFARIVKSRTLAAAMIESGALRINGEKCAKPSQILRAGDVLTLAQGGHARLMRVSGAGTRRGPYSEARLLYEDITPPVETSATGEPRNAQRAPGTGRPVKKERRAMERLREHTEPGRYE
ncbi:MAG TPA: RNA-binding protein [Alphaproteobacteria bacterium]|nr:RNA-binding protein [Alphaproteobacteria bacterium]HAJ48224.1 RNA-binding protein [Alphaproteobacteria bacterium]